jgi:hypothetical protein
MLGIVLGGPSLSLFDMILATRGWELDFPPLVLWFICLLGHGSFHFVPCLHLFWVLWLINGWVGFRHLKDTYKASTQHWL